MKLTVEKEIDDQKIVDLIITALEGGSNYWYWLSEEQVEKVQALYEGEERLPLSECVAKAVLEKEQEIEVEDLESPVEESEVLGTLSRESIKKALEKMIVEYPETYASFIEENYDAADADIFFQLAVMDDVVFG